MSGVKFTPGSLYITPGALEAFKASGDDVTVYLIRHLAGDWGDVDEHDRREDTDHGRGAQGGVAAREMAKGGEEDGKESGSSSFPGGGLADVVFGAQPEDERGQAH